MTTWDNAKRAFPVGSSVEAVVTAHKPLGMLVDICGFWGVVERIAMERDGFRTPAEYPPVGAHVACMVLGFREWCRQFELGLRPK